jgi:hypothetical protein
MVRAILILLLLAGCARDTAVAVNSAANKAADELDVVLQMGNDAERRLIFRAEQLICYEIDLRQAQEFYGGGMNEPWLVFCQAVYDRVKPVETP